MPFLCGETNTPYWYRTELQPLLPVNWTGWNSALCNMGSSGENESLPCLALPTHLACLSCLIATLHRLHIPIFFMWGWQSKLRNNGWMDRWGTFFSLFHVPQCTKSKVASSSTFTRFPVVPVHSWVDWWQGLVFHRPVGSAKSEAFLWPMELSSDGTVSSARRKVSFTTGRLSQASDLTEWNGRI